MYTSTHKTTRFEARITEDQKELFQKAARIAGHSSLSDFIVTTAQEKAQALVEKETVWQLSEAGTRVFLDLIENPPKPNAKLRQAAEEYKAEK